MLASDVLTQPSCAPNLENVIELESTEGFTTCGITLHGKDTFLSMWGIKALILRDTQTET